MMASSSAAGPAGVVIRCVHTPSCVNLVFDGFLLCSTQDFLARERSNEPVAPIGDHLLLSLPYSNSEVILEP